MKSRPSDLPRLLGKPASRPKAVLLHGDDAAQIVERREAIVQIVGGAEAEAEMRVARLTAAQCRADPAALDSALRARGFFPGDHVVVVTDATDALAAPLLAAARESAGAGSLLVVVAGALTTKSALRKGFEADPTLAAVPCDRAAPTRDEIRAQLAAHGVDAIDPDAADELVRLMAELDSLARTRLYEKLALWQHGSDSPLGMAAVLACAAPPGTGDADAVALAVLARDPAAVQRALMRALGQGADAVGLVLMVGRLARQLLEARLVYDDGGSTAEAALGRVFPPIPRPLQAPLAAVLGRWTRPDLERLGRTVHTLDATLRQGGPTPVRALTERTLLRLALAAAR